ncbi:hypothetical protein BDW62DRAFT_211907 [Aspergillus aurantiobrunneus]
MQLTRGLFSYLLYSSSLAVFAAALPGSRSTAPSSAPASAVASTPATNPGPSRTSSSASQSFPSTPPPIVSAFLEGLAEPDWDGINCSLPAATDSNMDPLDRWDQLQVQQAWDAAVDNWNKEGKDNGMQFSQSVGSFFKYTETLFCENLADNDGCSNLQVQCDQFSHPAGYMIVLSMIWLERQYLGMNSAITAGSQAVSLKLVDTLSAFAPLKPDDLEVEHVLLDIVSLGFSMSMSGMWNKVFKESRIISSKNKVNNDKPNKDPNAQEFDFSNELGTVKDWVNPLVTQSITILKDLGTAGTQLANEEALNDAIGGMADQWRSSINGSVNAIFNGSSDSIDLLYNTIKGGKFFGFNGVPSDYDLQNYVETALYSYIIPQAWTLAAEGPFVLDTGADCVDGEPDISEGYRYKWLRTDDVKDPWYCYNNKAYYLVGAQAKDYENCYSNTGYCVSHGFYNLPGADKLNGDDYGGITVGNIINGTLNGYFANGEKNGWETADSSDDLTLDEIFFDGITTPGVFMLPVCGAVEAWTNWHYYSSGARDKTDNYPCN